MTMEGMRLYCAVLLPGDPLPPGWYRKGWALNESHGKGALNVSFVTTQEKYVAWTQEVVKAREVIDLVHR